MGFIGSYEIVKRRVRKIKENYHKVAYMRFETEPGYQAQVDFGEFQVLQTGWQCHQTVSFFDDIGLLPQDVCGANRAL